MTGDQTQGSSYDVIVVGGGHNGLTAAAYLAGSPRGQKDLKGFAGRLSSAQRRALGVRCNEDGQCSAPSQPTFSRMFKHVSEGEIERVLLGSEDLNFMKEFTLDKIKYFPHIIVDFDLNDVGSGCRGMLASVRRLVVDAKQPTHHAFQGPGLWLLPGRLNWSAIPPSH